MNPETPPEENAVADHTPVAEPELERETAREMLSDEPQKAPVSAVVSQVQAESAPVLQVAATPVAPVAPVAPVPLVAPVVAMPAKVSDDAERQMRQMSRRSFLSGALAVGAAYGGWHWLTTRRLDNGVPWPFRRVLDTNSQFALDYFSAGRLAPTFPLSKVSEERTNGDIGLGDDFDPKTWQLNVSGLASGQPLMLSMADIKKLPRVEMTTEMKCIEGWSIIVHWAGVRFVDFAAKYPPATQSGDAPNVKHKSDDLLPYVGLSTPDNTYYVGMDMPSALHPQTLLCYEMNGKPLTAEHGAPLRLVTPVKYGVKHIKRIGSIEYATNRPADYWAEQGYDWYAGH